MKAYYCIAPHRSSFDPRVFSGAPPVWAHHHRATRPSYRWRRTHHGVHVHSSTRVNETDKVIRISMDIPGVKSNDIQIQIMANVLHIEGFRRNVAFGTSDTITSSLSSSWTFQKNFAINTNHIDTTNIRAHLANGVLTITVPRKQQQPSQTHTILVTDRAETSRNQDQRDELPDKPNEGTETNEDTETNMGGDSN